MRKVVLIRGPLGVGKTTIAKLLAEKYAGQHISIDEVLDRVESDELLDEEGGIPLKRFLRANELILPDITRNISEGTLSVIDGNFYHLEQIESLVGEILDLACFTLKASVEECIRRDKDRPNSYGEDAARAVHWMVSRFDFGKVIEVEGKTARQVLEEIELILAA